LFAKYCEKFEGEFTATMTAHFYSKPVAGHDPVEWWNFSTAIKGKLTLRYPKDASGKAVALSGQFEGGATHFTYYENVFSTDLYGAMIKGGYYGHKDVPPAATDNAEGGIVNALSSPTSFYVPVTGQYAGGKITLTLGAARTDFNDTYTRAHTFYVVIAPSTLMLPVMGHFTLPYMNAHFILDHLIKGDYDVGQAGKIMLLEMKGTKSLPGPRTSACTASISKHAIQGVSERRHRWRIEETDGLVILPPFSYTVQFRAAYTTFQIESVPRPFIWRTSVPLGGRSAGSISTFR